MRWPLHNIVYFAVTVLITLAAPDQASAQFKQSSIGATVTSVDVAYAKARSGQLVLVDIRTPDEWRKTGVPASGHTITMHQDFRIFIKALTKATGNDRTRPVGLICATGVRSSYLQRVLRKKGFTNVVNVVEGMMGSRYGRGWLRKKLPTRAWSGGIR